MSDTLRRHYELLMNNGIQVNLEEMGTLSVAHLLFLQRRLVPYTVQSRILLQHLNPTSVEYMDVENEAYRLDNISYNNDKHLTSRRTDIPVSQLRYIGYRNGSHQFERNVYEGRGLVPPPIITNLSSEFLEEEDSTPSPDFHNNFESMTPIQSLSCSFDQDPSDDETLSCRSFFSNLYDDPLGESDDGEISIEV